MGFGAPTMSVKEQKARLSRTIDECRSRIEEELKRYRGAADNLRAVKKKYDAAYGKYVKKPNEKNTRQKDAIEAELKKAQSIRNALRERIMGLRDTALLACQSIVELLGGEESREGRDYLKKFNKQMNSLMAKLETLERGIDDPSIDLPVTEPDEPVVVGEDEVEREESDTEEISDAAPAVEEPIRMRTASLTSVNVAPINIDVTPMVERAISSAISQLSAGLEARLRDYVDTLVLPSVTATPVAAPAGGASASVTSELGGHILEDESHVYEKLRTMYENIQTLIEGVAEISGTYMTLTAKLREVSELQRQVNDMQRRTMRDQQGVVTAQKVINDDQLDLTAKQRLIAEKQGEVTEAVEQLTAAQAAAVEKERELIAAQAEINGAMESLVSIERDVLSVQRTITESAEKLQQAQSAVAEKQESLMQGQKELLATQRQLQREQRTLAGRQPTSGGKRTKKSAPAGKSADDAGKAATESVITDVPNEDAVTEAPAVEAPITEAPGDAPNGASE